MKFLVSAILLLSCILMSQPAFCAERDSCNARWPEIVTDAAGTLVVNAGITEALKHSVHRVRPDGVDNKSFPSRHTSWAFAASTTIATDLYRNSPWWAVGAHTAASLVGLQRVVSSHHYATDVLAGAAIGVVSSEAVHLLCSRLFGTRHCYVSSPADFRMSLSVNTEALFWAGRAHRDGFMAGYATSAAFQLPLNETFGVGATLMASSTPLDGRGVSLERGAVMIGGIARRQLAVDCLAVAIDVETGAGRYVGSGSIRPCTYTWTTSALASLEWRLTRNFAARVSAGWLGESGGGYRSAVRLSAGSVVVF